MSYHFGHDAWDDRGDEAPGALWTGIVCFLMAAIIVFGFGLKVIEALPPGPGP